MGNSPFAFSLFLAVCCKHISEAVVVGGPPLSSGFCISRRLWRAVFYLLWSPPPPKGSLCDGTRRAKKWAQASLEYSVGHPASGSGAFLLVWPDGFSVAGTGQARMVPTLQPHP